MLADESDDAGAVGGYVAIGLFVEFVEVLVSVAVMAGGGGTTGRLESFVLIAACCLNSAVVMLVGSFRDVLAGRMSALFRTLPEELGVVREVNGALLLAREAPPLGGLAMLAPGNEELPDGAGVPPIEAGVALPPSPELMLLPGVLPLAPIESKPRPVVVAADEP